MDENTPIPPRNDNITRDVHIPYVFTMDRRNTLWFWPFVGPGKEFKKRKDTITWRGTTTGLWEKGHRFQMLEKYGGSGVHPLSERTPSVKVDFAFTNLWSDDGANSKKLNTTRYRLGERMSYADMQEYKYVLDVDGAGRLRWDFCTLLIEDPLISHHCIAQALRLVFRATSALELWFSSRPSTASGFMNACDHGWIMYQ